MFTFLSRCFSGQGTLAEASIGVLFFGGTLVAFVMEAVIWVLGGDKAPPEVTQIATVLYAGFLLLASVCIWRCAFNIRYWGVGLGARVLVAAYAAGVVAVAYAGLHAA